MAHWPAMLFKQTCHSLQLRKGLPAQAPGGADVAGARHRTNTNVAAADASPRHGCRPILILARPLTSGSLLRRTSSLPPVFLSLLPLTLMAHCPASVRLTAPYDFVLTMLSRYIARMTVIGWMLGASNNPAWRAGATLSFLTFLQIVSRPLSSWTVCPAGLRALP